MDNYPIMSRLESERAPYNVKDNPEEEFDITLSQTLSKTVSVFTDGYTKESDGDGGVYYDTSDIVWKDVYKNNDFHTPLQLISILKEILQSDLKQGIVHKTPGYTNRLIAECDNWIEDECECIED